MGRVCLGDEVNHLIRYPLAKVLSFFKDILKASAGCSLECQDFDPEPMVGCSLDLLCKSAYRCVGSEMV